MIIDRGDKGAVGDELADGFDRRVKDGVSFDEGCMLANKRVGVAGALAKDRIVAEVAAPKVDTLRCGKEFQGQDPLYVVVDLA